MRIRADLIDAVVSLRGGGAEILAIYHSHPRWAAIPSQTDLRENHYGEVPRIIVSLLEEKPVVRVWRLDPDSYTEVDWQVVVGADAFRRRVTPTRTVSEVFSTSRAVRGNPPRLRFALVLGSR